MLRRGCGRRGGLGGDSGGQANRLSCRWGRPVSSERGTVAVVTVPPGHCGVDVKRNPLSPWNVNGRDLLHLRPDAPKCAGPVVVLGSGLGE